jgi:5-methylcytosine-specific restriction protein B
MIASARPQLIAHHVRRNEGGSMGKTPDQLGRLLSEMYDSAPRGDKVASIHLFGIVYADEIRAAGANAGDVIRASGLKPSYVVEVNKGVRLAKFVVPKPKYRAG